MPSLRPLTYFLALLCLLTSCRGNPNPELSISTGLPADSIAYLSLEGDSLSRQDTLHFAKGEEVITLNPDTSLYQRAVVLYGRGERLAYYHLSGGKWQTAKPQYEATKQPTLFPSFSTTDIKGNLQMLDELVAHRKVAFTFVDYRDSLTNRKYLKTLDSLYKRDSLRHVLLYLNPSNLAVQRRMRRDSLTYTAISDSLGEVSRLRDSLGIARLPEVATFVVSPNHHIVRH